MSKISIVIPCLNEKRYIAECIDSILASDVDEVDLEVIFVDGKSDDNTVEIIQKYMAKHPSIHLLSNPQKITPISMNMGITYASGTYLFIISAHAHYDRSYFSKLADYCETLKADCTGGVLRTEVKHENPVSIAIKEVLSHRFGVGNASFRTGSNHIKKVDTVAFGCYRRDVFERYGLFDERLVRNQDIEFNKRIVNGGGKIYLIPEVTCTYYARENFRELAKSSYANGFWNLMTFYYTQDVKALSLRHFVPLIFVLSLLIPFLFAPLFLKVLWIMVISLLSYLSLVIIISLKMKKSSTTLFNTIASFLILHLAYGTGSLVGIFNLIAKFIKGKK